MVSYFKSLFRRDKKSGPETPATITPNTSEYRSNSNPPSAITPPESSRKEPSLRSLVEGKCLKLSDFDLRSTVGTGTFGRVRIVKLKSDTSRTPFALKMLKKSEIVRLKQVQHVKSEKQILMMIEHPFIVTLVSAFQDDKRLYMLMEYVNGGELFSYLRKQSRLSIEGARFYAAEITLAFNYLHEKNIVYRDLKPENLLIDSKGHIKITDFGFAKVIDSRSYTLCGTPEYLAPEIIQSKGHGKGVDYWALGILVYEMIAGYPPFYDENPFGIYQKILAGKLEFPSKSFFDDASKSLISKLLVQDSSKRLGCLAGKCGDVMRHKFFKNIDWNSALRRELKPPFLPPVSSADDNSMFDKYPEKEASSFVGESVDTGLIDLWKRSEYLKFQQHLGQLEAERTVHLRDELGRIKKVERKLKLKLIELENKERDLLGQESELRRVREETTLRLKRQAEEHQATIQLVKDQHAAGIKIEKDKLKAEEAKRRALEIEAATVSNGKKGRTVMEGEAVSVLKERIKELEVEVKMKDMAMKQAEERENVLIKSRDHFRAAVLRMTCDSFGRTASLSHDVVIRLQQNRAELIASGLYTEADDVIRQLDLKIVKAVGN